MKGRKLGHCTDDAMYKVKQHHESTDSISKLSYSFLLEELATASPSYGKKLMDFIAISSLLNAFCIVHYKII